jgi:hypothetical protein
MSNRTKITLYGLGLLIMLIAVRGWFALRSQPQLPASDEVFKTVDALFTAITAHDQVRLTKCQQRLEAFKSTGQLPAAAAKRLTDVIATARTGQWETAARRLYDFIHGQRREVSASPKPSARSADARRTVR